MHAEALLRLQRLSSVQSYGSSRHVYFSVVHRRLSSNMKSTTSSLPVYQMSLCQEIVLTPLSADPSHPVACVWHD